MLQGGKLIYPRAVAGFPLPLSRLLQGCISQLQAELKWAVEGGYLSEDELRDRIGYRVEKYIDRLLLAIDDQRHGASLLLIPERLISSPECRQALRIKYELQCPSLDLWETFKQEIFMSFRKNQSLSTADDAELYDNALTDSIQMIASATGVDGAVVLTDHFRLVGFGSEIVVPESSLCALHFACPEDDDAVDQQSLDTVGTRHRSAARFVQALPEAIAVVVSQDGAARSFEYSAGRVIGYSHTASRGYAL
jgi:hypothetical protein